MEIKKDWKELAKERRQEMYMQMKKKRKEYMNQPEVKERMQIAKFKAKNKRKALMKKIKEEKRISRK